MMKVSKTLINLQPLKERVLFLLDRKVDMPIQLSWLEQLICNQQVVGSSPSIGSLGEILKRPTRTDCKSVGLYLRRFESCSPHKTLSSGSSSVGRASAFQAECRRFEPGLPLYKSRCSSGVERFLGKEKVPSSTLGIGSTEL